jgi:hypothetical protein
VRIDGGLSVRLRMVIARSRTARSLRDRLVRPAGPGQVTRRTGRAPAPPEARIELFVQGARVDTHPELDGLDSDKLVAVWLAVVFWFGIKSGYLHRWERGELPDRD